KLQYATLSAGREIGGIPCAGGTKVDFYESGNLQYATLAKDHKIGNVECPEGTVVGIRESGTLKYIISKGSKTSFDENGDPRDTEKTPD
ncbi:MAG: hypothetical protein PHR74_06010, partial [Candidatus Omnitrophica bacterium]|nr:hypothetical protein [Syntrophorhabdaceae bacterium]MDD5424813.1 hypothetical protein [Candidatus Omnitrophota bacterium]